MKVSYATKYFFDYHAANSKKNTARSHLYVLEKFTEQYGARELQSLTTDEILTFPNQLTASNEQTTKSNR